MGIRSVVEAKDMLEARQEERDLDRLGEQLRTPVLEQLERAATHDVRRVFGRGGAVLEHVPEPGQGCGNLDLEPHPHDAVLYLVGMHLNLAAIALPVVRPSLL